MTKDEALKLALEALEEAHYKIEHKQDVVKREQAITAIKEALAQPEQEPCCYGGIAHDCHAGEGCRIAERMKTAQTEQEPVGEIVDAIEGAFKCSFTKMLPVGTKLYTTPPQRKPLTDEEIQHLLMPVRISGDGYYLRIARAIEAAHGIKGEA
jgi:hypothetical protein